MLGDKGVDDRFRGLKLEKAIEKQWVWDETRFIQGICEFGSASATRLQNSGGGDDDDDEVGVSILQSAQSSMNLFPQRTEGRVAGWASSSFVNLLARENAEA